MTDTYKTITTKKKPIDNNQIINEVLENEKKQHTNLLQNLMFANKQDEFVWNHLPLTEKQKEELISALN